MKRLLLVRWFILAALLTAHVATADRYVAQSDQTPDHAGGYEAVYRGTAVTVH